MSTLLCGMDHGTTLQGVAFIASITIYLVFRRRSTIHNIPGPPSPSWTFGHMLHLFLLPRYGDLEFKWQKLYGPVYRVKGCFGQDRLMISDPLALHHVLNSNHFEHGPSLANAGETHKRLRAAMQVGFTASAVRGCLPLFERNAQAVDIVYIYVVFLISLPFLQVAKRLEELPGKPANIMPFLSEATLNAISQATLSASTQDLGQDFVLNNMQILQVTFALSDVISLSWSPFRTLASSQSAVKILADAVAVRLPKWVWRAAMYLPITTFKIIRTAKSFAREIGERSICKKMEAGQQDQTDVFDMFLDLGRRQQRNTLAQEEIAAQTGYLILSSWEMLRLYPGGALEERMAIQDTVIPLTCVMRTSTGKLINQISVRKGQIVYMAIASYQRLESLWGKDAHEFRPSRWLDGTAYQGHALGPYANLFVNPHFQGHTPMT
ncbi:Cytochrome P450 [Mycena sanguinolenta]|uniref:Cytochrome P450 n=1 Tax=Mycena sanguinolenta TaxID=230812 RepID=A0A8H6YT84_9AGAR|nr:Cytochrome P450 [Mycena sanguinolenta]